MHSAMTNHDRRFLEMLEESAYDFDPTSLQVHLNEWMREAIGCEEVAFFTIDHDQQLFRCQVRNGIVLNSPVYVGSANVWEQLFATCTEFGLKDLRDEHLHQIVTSIFSPLALASRRVSFYGLRTKAGLIGVICAVFPANRFKEHCQHSESTDRYLRSAGSLLTIALTVERQQYLTKQCEVFLSMAQKVFSNLDDMTSLSCSIVDEAKELVRSETGSLYLVDKENSEVIAQVIARQPVKELKLQQTRFPLGLGIIGAVASSGQVINVESVDLEPLFNRSIDDITLYGPRNLMCVPIKDTRNGIVAVLMLYNKLGYSAFTCRDSEIATAFAVYCATSISHCLLYKKLQEAHRRSNMASELMMYHTQKIAEEDVLRLSLCPVQSPSYFNSGFDDFSFTPRSIPSQEMLRASLAMFSELGLIQKFRIKRKTLSRFLILVEKGYRDVPYHNWTHAFAVAHFCYLILKKCPVSKYLNDLECLSLFVAGLCHDIDHRGTTNSFQEQSKTVLAQLYSSEGSVLERHHFAQTMCILNMDNCNIFDELQPQEYLQVLDHMRDLILATDLAQHLRLRKDMQALVKSEYDFTNQRHHYLLLCLLITACDLADQTKHWASSKGIAAEIYKEFFSQGDLEKAMGNKPMAMMDRDRACIPKLQLDFLDTIALPVYEMLADIFKETLPVNDTILHSRRCWGVLHKKFDHVSSAHGNCSLDCLYNIELENEVLRVVASSDDALKPENVDISLDQ